MNNFNNIKKEDKKAWIGLSPDYANLGDIAISIAQRRILEKAYPDRKIVEFPMLGFFEYKDKIKELMNDDDIITIIGGRKYGKHLH